MKHQYRVSSTIAFLMQKNARTLACFLIMFALPGCLNATLWNYTASGTMYNADTLYDVTGSMIIDDTLRSWNGGYEAPPAEEVGPMGGVFSYYIPRYSLSLNEQHTSETGLFNGSRGTFYLTLPIYSKNYGDFEWSLNDGSGAWDQWAADHSCYYFYNADWSPYDVSEFNVLAPNIRLTNSTGLHVIGNGWENYFAEVALTRTAPAPVPEPATMLLFGAGLAGLAGMKRMLKKERKA